MSGDFAQFGVIFTTMRDMSQHSDRSSSILEDGEDEGSECSDMSRVSIDTSMSGLSIATAQTASGVFFSHEFLPMCVHT